MKRLFLLPLLLTALIAITVSAQKNDSKQYKVYGVAFYNLENLFDTINNNGKYDLEFSPQGARQWDGRKYWSKIHNMARAIASMTTSTTPNGPAIIGVSEIENRSVLEDLVKDPQIAKWDLQICHHDSPDRRGVDVGLLYNPRYFTLENVTNHRLRIEGYESFRTRDQMCVVGRLGGDRIAVIVNHWPSRLGGQERSSYLREAAGELSKAIADSLWQADPNIGVIVMGDLNDDPMDKSCCKSLGAVKEAKDAGEHGFYNPWWKLLAKGIGTLAYKGSWNLFDQIIISG
ncbi:MAG: endonuclease/exonuclease/phosphatase family protein, partial [Muribaculaceae bacterium]|nr:endonuclease/exonuclease/phosphatase family protein [Muribaculaceae bacterium]